LSAARIFNSVSLALNSSINLGLALLCIRLLFAYYLRVDSVSLRQP
jgi:hypothetical protein